MIDGGRTAGMAIEVVLGLGWGAAIAVAHLRALALNVRLYLANDVAWRPIALHAVRLAAVGAAFTVVAATSAPALLAALVGFSLGRIFWLRQIR